VTPSVPADRFSSGNGGPEASPSGPPAVELVSITKRFGQVVACDAVDLMLHRGRIHGILGENGAGKSTLMKVLIGLVLPDSGQILIDGEPASILDPIDAAAKGIGMVHQHFSLVDALTVWENVALGDVGRLDPSRVRDRVGDISRHYGLTIDPDAVVGELPAGMRQRVEIIKCLRRDPQVLIFDEPTSVLTPGESEQLFAALRRVVDEEKRAVALVSHKLDEIRHATDAVTIMRQGKVVDRMATADSDAATLARAMVGRPVSLRTERAALGSFPEDTGNLGPKTTDESTPGPAILEIRNATANGADGRVLLDHLSLQVAAGEILGVAGVEGNGQRELGDLLSSLLSLGDGEVLVDGVAVKSGDAGAMAQSGIAVVPEDRHDSGCVLDMTVAENLFLADPGRVSSRGVIDRKQMTRQANELIERFSISCESADAPLWSLSGGNQQRVVLARELAHDPKVLIAAQPTRGLDVGAIEYMSEQLRTAARQGVAVLLISTELEEILDLADRIIVLSRGRATGEMQRGEVDLESLGLLMGGAFIDDPATEQSVEVPT
jgi:simple sugar transport system ATP-binding protein